MVSRAFSSSNKLGAFVSKEVDMTNQTLLNNYHKFLTSIVASFELDSITDEEGIDIRLANRMARAATTTIRKANSYLEAEQDKEFWLGIKELCLTLITDLSKVLMQSIEQASHDGNIWGLLYCLEICQDVISLLYQENQKPESGDTIDMTIPIEQLEALDRLMHT